MPLPFRSKVATSRRTQTAAAPASANDQKTYRQATSSGCLRGSPMVHSSLGKAFRSGPPGSGQKITHLSAALSPQKASWEPSAKSLRAVPCRSATSGISGARFQIFHTTSSVPERSETNTHPGTVFFASSGKKSDTGRYRRHCITGSTPAGYLPCFVDAQAAMSSICQSCRWRTECRASS